MTRSSIILPIVGAVVGVLAIGTVRFVTLAPAETGTHFHANFLVVIDGEKLDLTDEKYMEDIGACKIDESLVLPVERAHMHARVGDVVHVHHPGVTWGHFFTNLEFTLGRDFLYTDSGTRYENDESRTLRFFVNGTRIPSAHDRLIESEDKLLITYGTESDDEVLASQFPEVPNTANAFNLSHFDPGGCAGGAPPETTGQRLRRAFLW